MKSLNYSNILKEITPVLSLGLILCFTGCRNEWAFKGDSSSKNPISNPAAGDAQIKVDYINGVTSPINASYTINNGDQFPYTVSPRYTNAPQTVEFGKFDLYNGSNCESTSSTNYTFEITNTGTTQLEATASPAVVVTKTSSSAADYTFSITDDLNLPLGPGQTDTVTVTYGKPSSDCDAGASPTYSTNSSTYESFDLEIHTNDSTNNHFNAHFNIFGFC
ncbi:MAG: hypothetical protein ACK41T_03910 [Pseudobdellovibrio sp.]